MGENHPNDADEAREERRGQDDSLLDKAKRKVEELTDAPEAAEVDYETNPVTGQPRTP